MKRVLTSLLLAILIVGFAVYFFTYRTYTLDTKSLSQQEKLALGKIDSKLSFIHTKSLDRKNGATILDCLNRLEFIDRTETVSISEINYIKKTLFNVDKAFTPTSNDRILKSVGESPTTTDILILLSQQCNYHKCPNVCIEDESYFYAWHEGELFQGSIVDKKYHVVGGWNITNNKVEIYK